MLFSCGLIRRTARKWQCDDPPDLADHEAVDFIVARYGEYVLLNPTKGGSNMILYYAGPAMLLFALLIGGFYLRTRARSTPEGSNTLNEEEAERLKRIMRD